MFTLLQINDLHYFVSILDKCDKPGETVPSPYDSCNTCACTDRGEIGACTEKGCIDGML